MVKRAENTIGVKVCNRQTNSLTPYAGSCGFILSVKFATALLASLAGDNLNNLTQVHYLMLKSCFGQHKG